MQGYRRDMALSVAAGTPAAVVLPRSTTEVQDTLRVATRMRTPVVPRGAGSGLSGGANAVHGCIVLCTTKMNRILDIDALNRTAVVEAGVVNADLSREVRALGLAYPPDPSSWEMSTLGGNLATNAGGLCCVKYGVTRDWCLGLRAVLADGTLLHTGRRTVKGVAGYDLTSLMIGSEGTLGVITEATLRLRPAPATPTTLVASFPTLESAGSAVARIAATVVPSLLEIMDRTTVAAVDDWRHAGLDRDAAALLFAQTDAPGDDAARELHAIAAACNAVGATTVAQAETDEESALLIGLRRLALPALERLGATLLDDVAVPCTQLATLMAQIDDIAERHDTVVATFGHAGDGNLHPTIVFARDDADAKQRALAAFDDIVGAALRLGGTVTGEHGIGRLKRTHLAAELGDAGITVHRSIKAALDPLGILNPGAVL